MDTKKAMESGVTALFGEKYGDTGEGSHGCWGQLLNYAEAHMSAPQATSASSRYFPKEVLPPG